LIVLQDSTDIRFLKQRAEANGYELIFRDGMIYFGPMRLEADHQAPILVYAGLDTNCIRISIQDDGHQPDQVAFDIAQTDGAGVVQRTVSPNLPLLGNESADSSQSGLADYVWRLTREGGRNEEETTALAQQRVNEQSMKIKAEGELDGSLYGHVLRVGEPVAVDGLGERYTGIYYVDTVNHQFDMDGYRQTFRLLRNAYGDNIEASQNPLENLL
jgi:phage protein D